MTVTDQIKILDRKIMQNEAQYDLDRKAAKISALSSNNLDKYEYLTGEDLGLKPSTIEQAKFEYSPLGKIFNKGLDKDDQKEGLFKRLKNIEDKNEELLKAKNKTENIKEVTDFVNEPLSLEAKNLIEQINIIQKDVDYRKLKIIGGNRVEYDFSDCRTFKELFRDLYYKKRSRNDAEAYQIQFDTILYNLNKYSPKNPKYIESKNNLVKNVKNFCEGRNKTIEEFKNNIFPVYYNETQVETSEADEESTLENEEIDTTDMPDLQSEKPAAEINITKIAELRTQKLNTIKEKESKNK